jgi:uncharacterized membrane protein YgcG
VPTGDGLSTRQRDRIEKAVAQAERASGLTYAVWVGTTDDDLRAHAERLHAANGAAAPSTVLVAVDPARRGLEIVTGSVAHRSLDDRSCGLAALTMTSCFTGGDLVGGIVQGLASLADHARVAPTLHLDQP